MLVKISGIRERLVTWGASKGPFSCVCSDVNNQMMRPREGLVTLGAGVFLFLHVSFYILPQVSSVGKHFFHTEGIGKASLLYKFYCEHSGYWTGWRTCYRRSRWRAYLLCVSSGDSSGLQTQWKPCHTGGRDRVFLPGGISCESSSYLSGKRPLYTWSRSKASRHCASSHVSSGPQTERKPCHTGGSDKVIPQCEFSYESASDSQGYWNGRMFCYNVCREKAVLQNVTLGL